MKAATDRIFWEEYLAHIGRSLVCVCVFEGPDAECPKGNALYRVATRRQEPVHQEVLLKELRAA